MEFPGISKKYDPVSAGRLWTFVLEKEKEFYDIHRIGNEGVDKVENIPDFNLVKRNSYIDFERDRDISLYGKKQEIPVKHKIKLSPPVPRNEKEIWEQKYRFFSRPYNVEKQPCEFFENLRMSDLYSVQVNSKNDEILGNQKPVREIKDKEITGNYKRVLDNSIQYLQEDRKRQPDSPQYTGFHTHKYRFFNGGDIYPCSGIKNRFIRTSSAPAVNHQRKIIIEPSKVFKQRS
jgi:hypothetical protein